LKYQPGLSFPDNSCLSYRFKPKPTFSWIVCHVLGRCFVTTISEGPPPPSPSSLGTAATGPVYLRVADRMWSPALEMCECVRVCVCVYMCALLAYAHAHKLSMSSACMFVQTCVPLQYLQVAYCVSTSIGRPEQSCKDQAHAPENCLHFFCCFLK